MSELCLSCVWRHKTLLRFALRLLPQLIISVVVEVAKVAYYSAAEMLTTCENRGTFDDHQFSLFTSLCFFGFFDA